MRVLVAHSGYRWPGGEETTIRNQASALRARGHEVFEHTVPNPSGTCAAMGALALAPFNPIEFRAVREVIRRVKPDVVHVHNTWFRLSPAVFRAAEVEGVPSVATIQNYRLACPQDKFFRDGRPCTDCLGRFPWPSIRHGCYRGSRTLSFWNGLTTTLAKNAGLLDLVGAFIVPSRFAGELLVEAGLPKDRIEIVANAVPDPGPRVSDPSVSDTILFVGRLSPEKGLDRLVEAFTTTDSGLRLVVYGDGPQMTQLAGQALPGVSLSGWQGADRIGRALRSARALFFPSRWFEVCPLVVIEALAAGLPVAASNLGAMPEMLEDIDERLLINDGCWPDAVEAAAAEWDIDDFSRRARSVYERHHTLNSHVSNLEAVYARAGGFK